MRCHRHSARPAGPGSHTLADDQAGGTANAIPGIITGTVLAVGRAAGETAAIMFTVAAFFLPTLPDSPFSQAMALPYHLTPYPQVPGMPDEIKWGTALVLLLLVLSFTLTAAVVRARFRRKRKW